MTRRVGDGIRVSGDGNRFRDQLSHIGKAKPLVIHKRLWQDGGRTYACYSADELIAIDAEAHHGRPGKPY